MGRPHKCPYCGLSETVAKGCRRTKTMGVRRIRLCKSCRRKFTPVKQKPVHRAQDEHPTEDAGVAPTSRQARWRS